MLNSNRIVQLVRKNLNAVDLPRDPSLPARDIAVKSVLNRVGREQGYSVVSRPTDRVIELDSQGREKDPAEWFSDIAWLEDSEDNKLRSVPLIAECDWSPRGWDWVYGALRRLLMTRADVRFLIYQESIHSPRVHSMVHHINCFKGTSSQDGWLFAAWVWDTEAHSGWRFRWYTMHKGEAFNI